jgi:hypothetical protein
VGQGVQQGRLADVRVTGECDCRRFGALTFLATHVALLAEVLQSTPQERDSASRKPAVGLELRLTRSARPHAGAERAHAAAEALEVLPHAAHARQVVFELCQLDLKLSLRTLRVLGEDVEDQLCAIDYAGLQGVLERALLDGVELVVHEEHLGVGLVVETLQLLKLSLAQVGTPVGPRAVLDELPNRIDERRVRELS